MHFYNFQWMSAKAKWTNFHNQLKSHQISERNVFTSKFQVIITKITSYNNMIIQLRILLYERQRFCGLGSLTYLKLFQTIQEQNSMLPSIFTLFISRLNIITCQNILAIHSKLSYRNIIRTETLLLVKSIQDTTYKKECL